MQNKTMSENNKRLEAIYNQHKDPLYNFVAKLCNDQDLAQDIVQQTFLKVLSNPDIADVEHLKAYLFTIARNKLKDEWKRKKAVSFEDEEIMQDSADSSSEYHSDASANESPEDASESDSSDSAVEKTIRQMPENFREVMLLRYTADLSVSEIAKITNRSVTDIKVSLHRARLKFETLHTASMYSKVAISRNRCETVRDLLQPIGNDEMTQIQLANINKHIFKCNVCANDAEDMKRTRQLFVALPLIPFPLAFDEFAKHLPELSSATDALMENVASQTGTQSVSQTTVQASVNSSTVTQTASQAIGAKIAAGVAAAAIVASSGIYLSGNDDSATSNNAPEQSVAQKPVPPTKKPVKSPINKQDGNITLTAKLSHNSQQNLKRVKWKIEPANKQQNISSKTASTATGKTGNDATFTLPAGKYNVTAKLDKITRTETVTIEAGKSSTKPVVFEAGELNVAMKTNKDINNDNVKWQLYSEANPNKLVATATGNFDRYLPAGKYLLHASYQGHLKKQLALNVSAGKTASISSADFSYGKLKLQAKLEKSGKLLGKKDKLRWSVDSLNNWKVVESNIILTQSTDTPLLLAPGTYRINLALGKHINKSTDVVIQQGKTTTSNKLTLKAGKLTLQARVAKDNPLLPDHVNWEIESLPKKRKTPIEKISSRNAASIFLPPGQYRVTAKYGTNMTLEETVTIAAGDDLIKNRFVFKPGAVAFTAKKSGESRIIKGPVNWFLEQQTNKVNNSYAKIGQMKSREAIFALQQGHYRITVEYGKSGKQIKEFDVAEGKFTKDTIALNDKPGSSKWEWK